MLKRISTTVALLAATAFTAPASAVGLTGDFATWAALAGPYIEDRLYGDEFTDISSLTLDDGTNLAFDETVNIRNVGSGWGTWCCGYSDDVLFNDDSAMTIDISPAVNDFGFYAEPNQFQVLLITLTLDDGSQLNQLVDGNGGAKFFGWNGAGVDSITVSSADTSGFAIGDFFVSAADRVVPEPATWAMMLAGFGAIGYAMRRRNAEHRVSQAV